MRIFQLFTKILISCYLLITIKYDFFSEKHCFYYTLVARSAIYASCLPAIAVPKRSSGERRAVAMRVSETTKYPAKVAAADTSSDSFCKRHN